MSIQAASPIALSVLTALALVTLTPLGSWMTASMSAHVLVQIPLLVAIGCGIGIAVAPRIESFSARWNAGGIPGILLAGFTLAFWMIPRWLDASLTDTSVEWLKYASLLGLAGVPLALSWSRLHPIARGVVKIEFLSMLFRLGWLYLISPDRFCNSYLLSDQMWLGRAMIMVGMALSVTWLIPVFFGELARQGPAPPSKRPTVSRPPKRRRTTPPVELTSGAR